MAFLGRLFPSRRLDVDKFRDELRRSALCRGVVGADVDALAELYESELHTILDRILPLRTSTRRRRPSDPWFDDNCRTAKRQCRKLERRATRSTSDATPVPGSSSDESIATWSHGDVKRSGSI